MALISLLFISISDSLVILVFLCVPENLRQTKKQTKKGMSGDSLCLIPFQNPPILLRLWARWQKHSHRHTRVYQRKCPPPTSPVLGRDRSKHDASSLLVTQLPFELGAAVLVGAGGDETDCPVCCAAAPRNTSQREHFFWYVPGCLGPTYIHLLFFLLPLHVLPRFPFEDIVHLLSAKNEIKKQQKIPCIHFLMLKML